MKARIKVVPIIVLILMKNVRCTDTSCLVSVADSSAFHENNIAGNICGFIEELY